MPLAFWNQVSKVIANSLRGGVQLVSAAHCSIGWGLPQLVGRKLKDTIRQRVGRGLVGLRLLNGMAKKATKDPQLDDFPLSLLREIGDGKDYFRGAAESDRDAFSKKVDGLRELREQGLVNLEEKNIVKDPDSIGVNYLLVGPCTLTYRGRKRLCQGSQ